MLLFLLSLGGIPFVVGFWAKLYVFWAAAQQGLHWMVLVGAILTVVALFYYLLVAPLPARPSSLQIDRSVEALHREHAAIRGAEARVLEKVAHDHEGPAWHRRAERLERGDPMHRP